MYFKWNDDDIRWAPYMLKMLILIHITIFNNLRSVNLTSFGTLNGFTSMSLFSRLEDPDLPIESNWTLLLNEKVGYVFFSCSRPHSTSNFWLWLLTYLWVLVLPRAVCQVNLTDTRASKRWQEKGKQRFSHRRPASFADGME